MVNKLTQISSLEKIRLYEKFDCKEIKQKTVMRGELFSYQVVVNSGDFRGFESCVFENNVCIDSGYCWGYDVRLNKLVSCHLLMYSLLAPICDVTVRNNTFYRARVAPIFKSGGPEGIPKGYRIEGNTFFIDRGQDIVYRNDCADKVYEDFWARIASENCIIESKIQKTKEYDSENIL